MARLDGAFAGKAALFLAGVAYLVCIFIPFVCKSFEYIFNIDGHRRVRKG